MTRLGDALDRIRYSHSPQVKWKDTELIFAYARLIEKATLWVSMGDIAEGRSMSFAGYAQRLMTRWKQEIEPTGEYFAKMPNEEVNKLKDYVEYFTRIYNPIKEAVSGRVRTANEYHKAWWAVEQLRVILGLPEV